MNESIQNQPIFLRHEVGYERTAMIHILKPANDENFILSIDLELYVCELKRIIRKSITRKEKIQQTHL